MGAIWRVARRPPGETAGERSLLLGHLPFGHPLFRPGRGLCFGHAPHVRSVGPFVGLDVLEPAFGVAYRVELLAGTAAMGGSLRGHRPSLVSTLPNDRAAEVACSGHRVQAA